MGGEESDIILFGEATVTAKLPPYRKGRKKKRGGRGKEKRGEDQSHTMQVGDDVRVRITFVAEKKKKRKKRRRGK